MFQSYSFIFAIQIDVPTAIASRLAAILAKLLMSNTVMSASFKFTYPAVGNAMSVGVVVVVGKKSGEVNL